MIDNELTSNQFFINSTIIKLFRIISIKQYYRDNHKTLVYKPFEACHHVEVVEKLILKFGSKRKQKVSVKSVEKTCRKKLEN